MKAETQRAIGEITAWIMSILVIYRLISSLSAFTPYQLPCWSKDKSFLDFLITFLVVVTYIIYLSAIRRRKLKIARKVFDFLFVLFFFVLGLAFLGILMSGKWLESTENLLLSLIILLLVVVPFGPIIFLLWLGVRGLERIEKDKLKSITESSTEP